MAWQPIDIISDTREIEIRVSARKHLTEPEIQEIASGMTKHVIGKTRYAPTLEIICISEDGEIQSVQYGACTGCYHNFKYFLSEGFTGTITCKAKNFPNDTIQHVFKFIMSRY